MTEMDSVPVAEAETRRLLNTRTAVVLVERLKEFRQSYNRTHGQVCEFFEQAHIIEKLYNSSLGPTKTAANKRDCKLEDSDNDEEEGCNEQKTWNIKQKLNSWRAVMREVVCDVCPNLQLENQPDINPGLMKHVLDEIRKLKTELAFQHNAILELTHQLENHQSNNKKKDRLIDKLLVRSREIRLENGSGELEESVASFSAEIDDQLHHQTRHHHHFPTSFEQEDLQFGSLECFRDLPFVLDEMQSYALGLNQEPCARASSFVRQGKGPCSSQALSAEKHPTHNLHSHSLAKDILETATTTTTSYLNTESPNRDLVEAANKEGLPGHNTTANMASNTNDDITTVTATNAITTSNTSTASSDNTLDSLPSPHHRRRPSAARGTSGHERSNKRQVLLSLGGRAFCAYAVCKILYGRARKRQ